MANNTLSVHEQKLLVGAWQCMNAVPEIDLDKLAVIMGHTNKGTTRNMLRAVRNKISEANGEIVIAAASTKSPATPSKRRRISEVVQATGSDDEENMADATPSKKKATSKRGTAKKKTAQKQEVDKETLESDEAANEGV